MSVGYILHVDFSNGDRNDKLKGFFNDTGITEMLTAKVYNKIDMV